MGYKDCSSKKAPYKETVDGLKFECLHHNDQTGRPLGDIRYLIVHWTAGNYTQAYDGYHYCILWDKAADKAHAVKILPLSTLGQHAYKFNSHAVGMSFCAMADGYPIPDEMLDAGAKFAAEFCLQHNLNPRTKQLMDHYMVDRLPQVGRGQKPDIHQPNYWTRFHALVLQHYDYLKAGKEGWGYRGILR